MEQEITQHVYPLEWLDVLINVTLNPELTDINSISAEETTRIVKRITDELRDDRIPSLIKIKAFSLFNEQQVGVLIKQYHTTLVLQIHQTLEHQKTVTPKQVHMKELYKSLLNYLSTLLSFLETRFFKFISPNERVSPLYLSVSNKELRKKLDQIKSNPDLHKGDEVTYDLVLRRIYYFTDKSPLKNAVTFRQVFYKKELVKGLENLVRRKAKTEAYSVLDEILIYFNFNSKSYIHHLTNKLMQKVDGCEGIPQKMEVLLFHFKAFNQLQHKPGVALNPKFHSLETVLTKWFTQEISYLERKMQLSAIPPQSHANEVNSIPKEQPLKEKQKVMCILSSDQTALILRAADELRLLIAKSMSEVFKTIVPYLSTPHKVDLSFDGMRSKSYVPEERDKQKAVEALEKMIKKIKDY